LRVASVRRRKRRAGFGVVVVAVGVLLVVDAGVP
jgi:hypothetical protein